MVGRLHDFTLRRYRLAHLTAAERLEDRHFQREMAALTIPSSDVRRSGARFQVVLLPLLVELRERTLAPLYDGIKKALAARGIECLDLSGSLGGFEDSDVWVLPFDQHPNHVANEVFAKALIGELESVLISTRAHAPPVALPRPMREPAMGPSLGP